MGRRLAPLALVLLLASSHRAAGAAPAVPFERLKALVGRWEAKTEKGAVVRVEYRLISNDSVLVQSYRTASGKETLTVIHPDGEHLLATHYCGQGNQPRLRLKPATKGDVFVFRFRDATNLAHAEDAHLVQLERQLSSATEHVEIETYQQRSKHDVSTLRFRRAPWLFGRGHVPDLCPRCARLPVPGDSGGVFQRNAVARVDMLRASKSQRAPRRGRGTPLAMSALGERARTHPARDSTYLEDTMKTLKLLSLLVLFVACKDPPPELVAEEDPVTAVVACNRVCTAQSACDQPCRNTNQVLQPVTTCGAVGMCLPACDGQMCTRRDSCEKACWSARGPSTCGGAGASCSSSCRDNCSASTSCDRLCVSGDERTCGDFLVNGAAQCTHNLGGIWGQVGGGPTVTLDPTAPAVPFREDMISGRLSNLQLTHYVEYPADTLTGGSAATDAQGPYSFVARSLSGAPARFAAVCQDWNDTAASSAPNISDATLIVVIRDVSGNFVETLVNNEASSLAGPLMAGGNAHSALVQQTLSSGAFRYTAFMYSNRRNTARCELRYSLSAAGPQEAVVVAMPFQHVGGMMVRVGAIPAQNDFFQTETPDDGGVHGLFGPTSHTQTRMALFRFPVDRATPPIPGALISSADLDAQLVVPSSASPLGTGYVYDDSRENYVLVGKRLVGGSNLTASSQTLVRADLVHKQGGAIAFPGRIHGGTMGGPTFDAVTGKRRFVGPPLQLPPGRYTIGIDAWVTDAVGDTDGTLGPNPGSNTLTVYHTTSGPVGGAPVGEDVERGRLNGPAFRYWVSECPSISGCASAATAVRKVPLGAFGERGGLLRTHRFYQEIDVGVGGRWFSPVVDKVEDNLSFGTWFAQRNAESAQLRVASANMWYDDHDNDGNEQPLNDDEYRNMADLLASRGMPNVTGFGFSDPELRGPFQFDSDIVAITEMGDKWGEAIIPSQRVAFENVATANDARTWSSVFGMDEMWDVAGSGGGVGAVFVASSQWPLFNDATSMRLAPIFPGTDEGECDARAGTNYYSCQLHDHINFFSSGFVPVTTRVRASSLPPVLVLGVHLDYSSRGGRAAQIEDINDMVSAMIAANPAIANAHQDPAPDGLHNRIILIGDFNIEPHNTGEHYTVLRGLRERFGYALDVALAIDGSYEGNASYAMHDVGGFGDFCRQTAEEWAALPGLLPRYDRQLDLTHCGDGSAVLHAPWWASTWRGKQHGWNVVESIDRNDAVVLVGRGWELDDPVRAYRVMQDSDAIPVNPFAPPSSPGATTSKGVSLWAGPHASTIDYQPRFDIGDGLSPGSAAASTDHRPIGATLRIWAGDSAR